MPTFTLTLGAEPVAVVAPEPGGFDPMAFRAAFPAGGLYGLDVETTYMDDLAQFGPEFRVRLVQFATVDTAWVLRIDDDEQRVAAVELLSDTGVSFCSHTPMDVLAVATRLGVDITGRNLDTRMLASLAFPGERVRHGLKTLATAHLGPELAAADDDLYDEFLGLWPGKRNAARSAVEANGWTAVPAGSPAYLKYAGLDAIACRRLARILTAVTEAPPQLLRVETWLAAQAARIQARGMLVDRGRLDALLEEATRETDEAREAVVEATGGIGPQSPRLLDWLHEHGADWSSWAGAWTKSGNPSLTHKNDNLRRVFDYPLDEAGVLVAEQLLRFKAHLDSMNKGRGVLSHLDPGGRVHPGLNTVGAVTGRMSSAGPNFQNFSKRDPRHRGLFVPEPGCVLVAIDFD